MDISQSQQQAQVQQHSHHQRPHVSSMGPPLLSPNGERHIDPLRTEQLASAPNNGHNAGQSQPVGAAAAAQQPKVVQTAFIHKLYKSVKSIARARATH